MFIGFCEAVSNEVVRGKAVRSKAVGFIDKWFVNKQVVVKLHDQLIAIRDYIYKLNLIIVYLNILNYNGRRRRSCV